MSITDNYTTDTLPDNNDVKYPETPCATPFQTISNKPYINYDGFGKQIGYFWYYGDLIDLNFDITGNIVYEDNSTYQEAAEFLKDKKLVLTLYTYNYQKLTEQIIDGAVDATFTIDAELSQKMVPGIYYCSLKIIQDTTTIYTLFGPSSCVLQVR